MLLPEQKLDLLPVVEDAKKGTATTEESTEEDDESGSVFLEDEPEPYAEYDDDTPHSETMNKARQTKNNRLFGSTGMGVKQVPRGKK